MLTSLQRDILLQIDGAGGNIRKSAVFPRDRDPYGSFGSVSYAINTMPNGLIEERRGFYVLTETASLVLHDPRAN